MQTELNFLRTATRAFYYYLTIQLDPYALGYRVYFRLAIKNQCIIFYGSKLEVYFFCYTFLDIWGVMFGWKFATTHELISEIDTQYQQ